MQPLEQLDINDGKAEETNANSSYRTRTIDIVMYDQSLRSLPSLESRRNRTQDQPLVFRLHVTDGFRSHGNLTPPRGRRVSP